jgi:hypothetical protein
VLAIVGSGKHMPTDIYPAEIDAGLAKVDAQAVETEEFFRRRQEMLR